MATGCPTGPFKGLSLSIAILLLITSMTLCNSVRGKVLERFIARKLQEFTLFHQETEEPSVCLCQLPCMVSPTCTAFSLVFQDNGMIGCYSSNKSSYGWDDTERNPFAITFFKAEIEVTALTRDQEKEMMADFPFLMEIFHKGTPQKGVSVTSPTTTTTTTLTPLSSSSSSASPTPASPLSSTDSSTFPSTAISTNVCPEPFTNVENVGCLYLSTEEINYYDAEAYCGGIRSRLYVASSMEEFYETAESEYIKENAANYIWVGEQDQRWANYDPPANGKWGQDEPTGSIEHCTGMILFDRVPFVYEPCFELYQFLCQNNSENEEENIDYFLTVEREPERFIFGENVEN